MKRNKVSKSCLLVLLSSCSFLSSCKDDETNVTGEEKETIKEKYKVTFNLNNSENEVVEKEVLEGDSISYPGAPLSKNNLEIFSHWEPYYEKMPKMNLVINAVYTNVVTFGMYPQSIVRDTEQELLNRLNASVEVPTFNSEENVWDKHGFTAFDWYDTAVKSEYAFYIDKELDGTKYRGIYYTKYRNNAGTKAALTSINASSSRLSAATRSRLNEMMWFRYEPINWLVLDNTNGEYTLLSAVVLDSCQFQGRFEMRKLDSNNVLHWASDEGYADIEGKLIYPNNYEYSDVREFLNTKFIDTAFSSDEKSKLRLSRVTNDYSTTRKETSEDKYLQYLSNDFDDYVYIPSAADLTLYRTYIPKYRLGDATHYLFSTCNCSVSTSDSNRNKPQYMFRSIYKSADNTGAQICGLQNDGNIGAYGITETVMGNRPIIKVKL